MKILENDIASIEPFGMIDGNSVKLVRTKGGLNLATMVDSKGAETVLGAASHQAILCYNIEQRFPKFQSMIMKSDKPRLSAESHSHFLSNDLRKSGHDIYSIQNGNDVDFYITKLNMKVACVNSSIKDDCLHIDASTAPKEYVGAISGAVSEKALTAGLKGVKVK